MRPIVTHVAWSVCLQGVAEKNYPLKTFGYISPTTKNFTRFFYVHIYAKLQNFTLVSQTLTKLCHISAIIFEFLHSLEKRLLVFVPDSILAYNSSIIKEMKIIFLNKTSLLSLLRRLTTWHYPRPQLSISSVRRALSSKPPGRHCCCRSMGHVDRRMDGRTPDRYINPALHIMRAVSISYLKLSWVNWVTQSCPICECVCVCGRCFRSSAWRCSLSTCTCASWRGDTARKVPTSRRWRHRSAPWRHRAPASHRLTESHHCLSIDPWDVSCVSSTDVQKDDSYTMRRKVAT